MLFQMMYLNEDDTRADAIQLQFNFTDDDLAMTYKSEEIDYDADEPGFLSSQSYVYTMAKDATTFEEGDSSPNSSKAVKTEDDVYRLYFQRTTPSIAGLGIGKTVDAAANWFVMG